MCFPDGITVEPIDGASYQPAVAEVQITRNSQAIVTSARQYEYRLLVTSTISNDASVGQTFRCPFGFGYDANHVFMQGYLDLPVPEPAQGTLYPPVDLPVPGNLAAGTPLTLPIILKLPQESIYQYPPYKDKPAICSTRLLTSPGYVITVNAVLMCTDVITKQTAPCPPSQYGSMQDTQQYRP